MNIINYIKDIKSFRILLIVIFMDVVFGILRAIKEKNINSTFGINGIIRKVGMILAVIFIASIQYIIDFNFIGFLPEAIKEVMDIKVIGIDSLFLLLFNIFEILSIFKNMVLCGLPIPRKLQLVFEKFLEEYTNEIKS